MTRAQDPLTIPGAELDARLIPLLQDATVRRITIGDMRGNALVEIPVNAATTAAPASLTAALRAMAAAAPQFTIAVQRAPAGTAAAAARPSLAPLGASEDQMDTRHTIGQRIDRKGTKIEDLAGVGGHDSQGG
ncbi:MAG TPA: DUF4342 domain-containing protein [Bryobacteraceae bacterium]|nr:DUF4342 domain-containing protein [Bryobacteraceae bacterium]